MNNRSVKIQRLTGILLSFILLGKFSILLNQVFISYEVLFYILKKMFTPIHKISSFIFQCI